MPKRAASSTAGLKHAEMQRIFRAVGERCRVEMGGDGGLGVETKAAVVDGQMAGLDGKETASSRLGRMRGEWGERLRVL